MLWHEEVEGDVEYSLFDGRGGVQKLNFDQASTVGFLLSGTECSMQIRRDHNLKHREPTASASMWSLLQVLRKGGSNYLVDVAMPHANKRYNIKLSLVAHSYQPESFKGYLRQMSITSSRPLIMDPWTPAEILKVAAKLHPQLSSSLVSWQESVTAHAHVCHVALLLPCTC